MESINSSVLIADRIEYDAIGLTEMLVLLCGTTMSSSVCQFANFVNCILWRQNHSIAVIYQWIDARHISDWANSVRNVVGCCRISIKNEASHNAERVKLFFYLKRLPKPLYSLSRAHTHDDDDDDDGTLGHTMN